MFFIACVESRVISVGKLCNIMSFGARSVSMSMQCMGVGNVNSFVVW